jgi:hypothetical protein
VCKTNPISTTGGGCRAGLPHSGTACRGNPRSGRRQALRGGEVCETNPIWPGRRRVTEGKRAKRSQTWTDWGIWAKAAVMWGVARPGSETCKTNPIWPRRGRVPEGRCAKRTQFGPRRRQMHKTNPISPRRKRLTEEILQNEAKLEKTGGCGQRQLLRGAWLGRGVERAKRTQFCSTGGTRLRIGDCGLRIRRRRPGADGGGKMRKTNPIWLGRWVESPLFHYSIIPPFQSDAGRAKRTQSGPCAREWARGGGPRCPAGVRLCKTKPISKSQVSGLEFQVSRRRGQARHALTSHFTLQTSHFLRAKRSQFAGSNGLDGSRIRRRMAAATPSAKAGN